MIIKICQGQEELAVDIVQAGCDGGKLVDLDLRLLIKAPDCPCIMTSPYKFEGCWPQFPELPEAGPLHHTLPTLVYPASYINKDGNIVFRLDQLLFKFPPGRYFGYIETRSGHRLAALDLDLCTTPFILKSATVRSGDCGSDL